MEVSEVIRGPHKGGMKPIKNITLGLAFVLVSSVTVGSAWSQTKTYTVKPGDTVGGIATDHGMKIADLAQANNLSNAHKLKLGQVLVIPKIDRKPTASSATPSSGYAVRNGDNDWNIAARNGIKPSQLRAANPSVNWKNLKIGTRLSIPGKDSVASKSTPSAKTASRPTVAGRYIVRNGDNDWTIASRLGTTPKQIRLANPGVKWTRIKPGDQLQIPAATGQVVVRGEVTGSKLIKSRYAVVTGNSVIIRRGPSTDAKRVTLAAGGTKVKVLGRKGDWYQLRFPMGTEGWVRGDLLAASNPPRITEVVRRMQAATPTRVVSQSSKSKRVATNRRSDKKTYTASKRYTSGTSIVAASPTTVVARAQSWRGVRYRYGSASRSGTDCSGFTSQLYRTVGVSLPRTSRAQAQVGQRVGKGSLKSGDLVFFRTSRGNRISHVGIYQGNGKFIHASNPRGGVMVSSLSDGYYSKRFVTARRVASGGTSASRKKSGSSVKSVASKAKAAPREEPFPDKVPPLEPAAKN
jgi:hypothetical protein